jgi:hypothetical protein
VRQKKYRLVREKVTDRTVAYSDVDGNLPRLIYIPKTEFNDPVSPRLLTLLLQWEEE